MASDINVVGMADFDDTTSKVSFDREIGDGFVKILGFAELAANAKDQRLLIQVNKQKDKYTSGMRMHGLYEFIYEMDARGFYVGRNGYYQDCTVGFECTISIRKRSQRIVCNGISTFSLANNRILGCETHGVCLTKRPLSSVTISFEGGVAEGHVRAIRL